jgi:hypothetical protein
MVGQHAGNPPSTHLRDLGAPAPPCSPTNRPAPGPGPAPLVGQAASAAPQPGRLRSSAKSGVDPRASHARPPFDHSLPARPDSGSHDQALTDHSDPSNPVQQPWPVPPHRCSPDPARLQRPRTLDACPSGHPDHPGRVDTRRVDTGRVDTGRPPDQLDGRRSAWRTADADSATNGVTGVRTSWTARRRRPPDGQPKLARVAASAALGNPITPPR